MEVNWSSYLSNMNAYDFAHSMGGTRINPLEEQQIEAIEAKLLQFKSQVGPLAEAIQNDPDAKKNLESIFEKVFNERKLRVFYGFEANDCARMEGVVVELQELFHSVYPGLIKLKRVSTLKKAVEEPKKLPPVERVDESLLKESLACLSRIKELSRDDKNSIRQLLDKVVARLNDYPADKIPDEILENMARLYENMNEVFVQSQFSVFRLCVERNIAVPCHILEEMLGRCQYKAETMKLIEHQLESLVGSRFKFSGKLVNFKPDFSNEFSAQKSRQALSLALKTILAFPEEKRSSVQACLDKLKEILNDIPVDACPEIQDFFQKDVPIQFLDKIVPCKPSDVLRFCSSSPVLYVAWKKNLEKHTPGVHFDQLGITHDVFEALKNDCWIHKPHVKNPYVGMALWHYLDVPQLEAVYAEAAQHSNAAVDDILEAYRNSHIPDLAKFPSLGKHVSYALAKHIEVSTHLGTLVECLLIGLKIVNESRIGAESGFVHRIFDLIPGILSALRHAVKEQLFEDVQDCESCILHLVSLLERVNYLQNLGPAEFIHKSILIYQSLLAFNKEHPIPDVVERYRKKLTGIIRADLKTEIFQSIIPSMESVSDPWLLKHFTEITLARLNVSPEKFGLKLKYFHFFETAIRFAIESGCLDKASRVLRPFFGMYISHIWRNTLNHHKYYGNFDYIIQFQNKIAMIGKLQEATLSDEDEFVVLAPKLELDLRDCRFHKELFASLAAHLKVDKLILKKKGWLEDEGLNGSERNEVEKMFAKFPKGTIVWF